MKLSTKRFAAPVLSLLTLGAISGQDSGAAAPSASVPQMFSITAAAATTTPGGTVTSGVTITPVSGSGFSAPVTLCYYCGTRPGTPGVDFGRARRWCQVPTRWLSPALGEH